MSKIRIGYACINTQLPSPNRTCRLKNATPDRILELARENLERLEQILLWNAENNIRLFRISSDAIPFGSHEINTLNWLEILQPEFKRLSEIIHRRHMRVSMHPGQYTVLNSLREDVIRKSVAELDYHARFLDALGVDESAKIILHIGGAYGDKPGSLQRFARNFSLLSESARNRLIIENDEKSYTLADVLPLSREISAPVVFDVFHHSWNPSFTDHSVRKLIEMAMETWREKDGRPKIHYSNQWPGKPPGAHSFEVDPGAFLDFHHTIHDLELDVMLETKNKEQSVLNLFDKIPELSRQETRNANRASSTRSTG